MPGRGILGCGFGSVGGFGHELLAGVLGGRFFLGVSD